MGQSESILFLYLSPVPTSADIYSDARFLSVHTEDKGRECDEIQTFKNRDTPAMVPPVPAAATNACNLPLV